MSEVNPLISTIFCLGVICFVLLGMLLVEIHCGRIMEKHIMRQQEKINELHAEKMFLLERQSNHLSNGIKKGAYS